MATAYIEIDGLELTIDEYESYILNNREVKPVDHLELRELNTRFGYPDKNGAML